MTTRAASTTLIVCLAGLLATVTGPAAAAPPVARTVLVSVSSTGVAADRDVFEAEVSGNGRYVAFAGDADNLVANDLDGFGDVFRRDRWTGVTERVSRPVPGLRLVGDIGSREPSISGDGRFVAFSSDATGLVLPATERPTTEGPVEHVYVRDVLTGMTTAVDVSTAGVLGPGDSYLPSISADGGSVAFVSESRRLVPGDTNHLPDVFVRDLRRGTTVRADVSATGQQALGFSDRPSLDADGTAVAFESSAGLVPGVAAGTYQVYVKDLRSGAVELASRTAGGVPGNASSTRASLSGDGTRVAFVTGARNLLPGPLGSRSVLVHVLSSGTNVLVSATPTGGPGRDVVDGPRISRDGTAVVFSSRDPLVVGDTNGVTDAFVRELAAATTRRVSVTPTGGQAPGGGFATSISADGSVVAFLAAGLTPTAGALLQAYVRLLPAPGR